MKYKEQSSPLLLMKNIFAMFFSRVSLFLIAFISRPILIRCVGVEMLGIASGIGALLTTLSLAELGFHASVVYRLYKPLADKDYDICNAYLAVLKRAYQIVALFIIVFIIILAPFLKYFLKGTVINSTVYIIYFLLGLNSACSYLFADKTQLFYAAKKDYVSKRIEIIYNIVFKISAIIAVLFFKNYFVYVSLTLIQTVLMNLTIYVNSKKYFFWIKKTKIQTKYILNVLKDIRNLCVANFSGYVYFNTDNLLVSSLIGAATVTFLTNYTLITSQLNNLADAIIRQIEPFLGAYYSKDSSGKSNYFILLVDSFVRFLAAAAIVIPILVLLPSFITWWVGAKFLLSFLLLTLLCIDLYIYIVHRALCDYIAITGSYKYESRISLIGAIINLGLSIVLIKVIGLEGTLVGTVIANIFFWIARGYVVFKKIFKLSHAYVLNYIIKNLIYISVTIGVFFLCLFLCKLYTISMSILDFCIKGLMIEVINILVIILVFRNTKEICFIKEYFFKKWSVINNE